MRGTVLKYGDNINTDIISPAKYMELAPEEQGKYAMTKIDPEFPVKVKDSPIVVGGANFGNGSSRETAPIALKAAGTQLVIAKFFARIFYRNCINIGLPVIELQETDDINNGDELEVLLQEGIIVNHTSGKTYQGSKLPDHILEIVEAGGLVDYIKQKGRR